MRIRFDQTVAGTVVLCLALASLAALPEPRYSRSDRSVVSRFLRIIHKVELNREAHEAQTAGYYEGLLNEGSRVSGMNALATDDQRFTADSWALPWRRHRGDFLYWDMPPHLKAPDDGPRFDMETNSHGMADLEYSVEKPERTWRVALLGDSITRGQGAPFGRNFEFLLEARLDEEAFQPVGRHLEILNFAVGGYRITQLVDVGLEQVPRFSPDVYVFPLTELSVFRKWGEHVATLVQNDIDLKYDYLRRMVREAGVRKSDPAGTIDAKLARYRLPTVRWAVEQMKAAAARQGAPLIVMLVASGSDPELLEEQFVGVREILTELQVPYIDLLDAFVDVDDLRRYRVSDKNNHPNELGHRQLFELLHARLVSDPVMFRRFCGPDARLPAGDASH